VDAAVYRLAQQYRLSLTAVHAFFNYFDPTEAQEKTLPGVRQVVAFAEASGAEAVLLSQRARRGVVVTTADLDHLRYYLDKAAFLVKERGLQAYFHNCASDIDPEAAQMSAIIAIDPNRLDLAYDVSNTVLAQGPDFALLHLQQVLPRVRYVHYHDTDSVEGRRLLMEWHANPLDWRAVAALLHDAGYTGWVMGEIILPAEPQKAPPLAQQAQALRAAMQRIFGV